MPEKSTFWLAVIQVPPGRRIDEHPLSKDCVVMAFSPMYRDLPGPAPVIEVVPALVPTLNSTIPEPVTVEETPVEERMPKAKEIADRTGMSLDEARAAVAEVQTTRRKRKPVPPTPPVSVPVVDPRPISEIFDEIKVETPPVHPCDGPDIAHDKCGICGLCEENTPDEPAACDRPQCPGHTPAKPAGPVLTANETTVLKRFQKNPAASLTFGELVTSVKIDGSGLFTALKGLEKKGLVTREGSLYKAKGE